MYQGRSVLYLRVKWKVEMRHNVPLLMLVVLILVLMSLLSTINCFKIVRHQYY